MVFFVLYRVGVSFFGGGDGFGIFSVLLFWVFFVVCVCGGGFVCLFFCLFDFFFLLILYSLPCLYLLVNGFLLGYLP